MGDLDEQSAGRNGVANGFQIKPDSLQSRGRPARPDQLLFQFAPPTFQVGATFLTGVGLSGNERSDREGRFLAAEVIQLAEQLSVDSTIRLSLKHASQGLCFEG